MFYYHNGLLKLTDAIDPQPSSFVLRSTVVTDRVVPRMKRLGGLLKGSLYAKSSNGMRTFL